MDLLGPNSSEEKEGARLFFSTSITDVSHSCFGWFAYCWRALHVCCIEFPKNTKAVVVLGKRKVLWMVWNPSHTSRLPPHTLNQILLFPLNTCLLLPTVFSNCYPELHNYLSHQIIGNGGLWRELFSSGVNGFWVKTDGYIIDGMTDYLLNLGARILCWFITGLDHLLFLGHTDEPTDERGLKSTFMVPIEGIRTL